MAVYSNEVIEVLTDVETLTIPEDGWPQAAILSVQEAAVRLTLHGEDPVNAEFNGVLIPAGGIYRVTKRDMASARMISADGVTTAYVSVNYEQGD